VNYTHYAMYETSELILILTPHQARICGGEIFLPGNGIETASGSRSAAHPIALLVLDGTWTAPVRVRGAAGSNGRVRCPPPGQDRLYPAGAIDLDPLDGPGGYLLTAVTGRKFRVWAELCCYQS
jgi:hypothetical protein